MQISSKYSFREIIMAKRVALVTGANKGIGLEIANQLARQGITVVMGSRDIKKGEEAINGLYSLEESKEFDLHLVQLDVTDFKHIQECHSFIDEKFGRLDILVNNAGVMIDGDKLALDLELAELARTLGTNLYGPLFLCRSFIPMMLEQNYGRVVNISSTLGSLTEMSDPNSAYELVRAPAYRISKTALNSLTTNIAIEIRGKNVLINSCCPGWTKTDMGGVMAPNSIAEGADTPVWLATLPDGGPSGYFFRNREKIPW